MSITAFRKWLALFFLWGTLHGYSQTSAATYQEIRNKGASFLYQNPDSARYYFNKYLRMVRGKHDSLLGIGYNNLGVYYIVNLKYDSAIHYLNLAIPKLEGSNAARIRVNLANLYRRTGNLQQALHEVTRAEQSFRQQQDKPGLALAYAEKGSCHNSLLQHEEAIACLRKAIDLFTGLRDKKSAANSKVNLALLYMDLQNPTFATDLFEEALPILRQSDDTYSYTQLLSSYGAALLLTNKPEKALEIIRKSAENTYLFQDLELRAIAFSRLGAVYAYLKQPIDAETAFQTAVQAAVQIQSPNLAGIVASYLKTLQDLGKYSEALRLISETEQALARNNNGFSPGKQDFFDTAAAIFERTQQYQRCIDYLRKSSALQDSLAKKQQDLQIQKLAATYQNQLQRQKNRNLEQENTILSQRHHLLLVQLGIALLIAFGLLALWIYSLRLFRQKARIAALELEEARLAQLLRDQELVSTRRIKQEQEVLIDRQKQQLAVSSIHHVRLREELLQVMNELKAQPGVDFKSRVKALEDTSYWQDFLQKFNLINPDFISSLSSVYPALNQSELVFCALVRLNLSFKEIADILHIAPRSVYIKKYRITKKMALGDDADFYRTIITWK